MPSIFRIGSYVVFFWSNENNEPIHVHICKGSPVGNSTKIWITKAGGCIVANNGARIPNNQLKELLEVIQAQFFIICDAWKNHFRFETINFYC